MILKLLRSLNQQPDPIALPELPLVIEIEKYFAVDYVATFYMGYVLKTSDKPGLWHMKFLHHVAKNFEVIFKWPRAPEFAEVHENGFLDGITRGCGWLQSAKFT